MSRNFTVYQSRNRETGTLTRMHDTKHKDSPKFLADGPRYIALCVEHKVMKRFDSHYEAGRAIAHVTEWCKPCVAMVKKNQKLSAEAIHAYSDAKLVGDDRFYAYDKRWHDNAKKVTQTRTVDSNGMFNQSKGVTYATRQANNATQAKAKNARKPSAVTVRKAKRKEITKPDPNQLDIVDAKTFNKNTRVRKLKTIEQIMAEPITVIVEA